MRSPLSAFNEVWQQQLKQRLLEQAQQFPQSSSFFLACSGGMDSMLLLHLCAELFPQRLQVISIDHQLQAKSRDWSNHVLTTCQQLQIPCELIPVTVAAGNLEQQARLARYQALHSRLGHHDVLLLAHHQQDQAETMLLRLLQGTGVDGLAAMRMLELRRLDETRQYFLWRPLLSTAKQQIEQWQQQLQFTAVDDPMNHEAAYDRVWCREQLWPLLSQRFAKMQAALCRTAQVMQDAQQILEQVLLQDAETCICDNRLDITQLNTLTTARQRQLLSYFMQADHNYRPPFAMVERIQQQVIAARDDAQSILYHANYCFVRYERQLYRYTRARWQQFSPVTTAQPIIFSEQQNYQLASGMVHLVRQPMGLSDRLLGVALELKPRQGGEKIQFWGRAGHRILKKELQQAKIAPWLRHQIQILVYHNVILGVLTPQGFWLAQHEYCQPHGWQPQLITHDGI